MFTVETTIRIARPVDEVFGFVADMTNAPSWQRGLHSVRRIPPGPVGVGSEHVFERRFAGRVLRSANRITAYNPPRLIAFEIPEGWIRGRAHYVVDPAAGGSQVTCRMEFTAAGPARLFEPVLARVLAHDARGDDQHLKALLEHGPQPSRPGTRLARWALFAGVTGCAANGLLAAYYASSFTLAWAGPGNDLIGGVLSTTATIPVLLGLPALLPRTPAMRAMTALAPLAAATLVTSSVLLVADVIDFGASAAVGVAYFAALTGWLLTIGRSTDPTGILTGRIRRTARWIGSAGLAGLAFAGAAAVAAAATHEPRGLPVVLPAGMALTLGVPAAAAIPIWMIALARHLARPPDPADAASSTDPLAASHRAQDRG